MAAPWGRPNLILLKYPLIGDIRKLTFLHYPLPMPLFNLQEHNTVKICVIGDIMLDHYINGSCSRISPEAPVQIVDVSDDIYTLGGAGNVLENLKAFGCEASIISIANNDSAGDIIKSEVEKLSPAFYHLVHDETRRTTIKSRVIVNRHQLMRLDKEDKHYCNKKTGPLSCGFRNEQ